MGDIERESDSLSFLGADIEFHSVFETHSSGVVSRRDILKNISSRELSLSTLLSRFVFNGGEYQVYTQ